MNIVLLRGVVQEVIRSGFVLLVEGTPISIIAPGHALQPGDHVSLRGQLVRLRGTEGASRLAVRLHALLQWEG